MQSGCSQIWFLISTCHVQLKYYSTRINLCTPSAWTQTRSNVFTRTPGFSTQIWFQKSLTPIAFNSSTFLTSFHITNTPKTPKGFGRHGAFNPFALLFQMDSEDETHAERCNSNASKYSDIIISWHTVNLLFIHTSTLVHIDICYAPLILAPYLKQRGHQSSI